MLIIHFTKKKQRVEQQLMLAKGDGIFLPPAVAQAIDGENSAQPVLAPDLFAREGTEQAGQAQSLQTPVDLIQPGETWFAHKNVVQNNRLVQNMLILREILT